MHAPWALSHVAPDAMDLYSSMVAYDAFHYVCKSVRIYKNRNQNQELTKLHFFILLVLFLTIPSTCRWDMELIATIIVELLKEPQVTSDQ